MSIEIERKFLVRPDRWHPDPAKGVRYRQGYLSTHPGSTVRVRMAGDQGFLTIKGPTIGISRLEFEYPIAVADAEQLLREVCHHPIIEKIRFRESWDGFTWEVDLFEGENAGLIVAEIELPSAETPFNRPPWVGREVSGDPRYYNQALSRHPYSQWGETG